MSDVKIKKLKGKSEESVLLAKPGQKPHRLLFTFAFLLLPFAFCLAVPAQDDEPIPPPVIVVTNTERQKLDAATDSKERTKLSLGLMNSHLSAAEKFSSDQDFDAMFRELGGFHGLLDNAMVHLERQNSENGKVLDNYKRLEIGLRGFSTRLEGIRRDMPIRYEDYVRKLLIYLRDMRTKAAEPFFKDTIVPNQKP